MKKGPCIPSEHVTVRVADHFRFCGTRDRASALVSEIQGRLTQNSEVRVRFSFESVSYVSSSFLHQLVCMLHDRKPEGGISVVLSDVSEASVRRMRSALPSQSLDEVLSILNPDENLEALH